MKDGRLRFHRRLGFQMGLAEALVTLLVFGATGFRTPRVPESAVRHRPVEVPEEGYVSSKACETCHPVSAGVNPANRDTLRVTYGFGSGEIMATDGEGVTYDLTRFLDDEGNLIADFPNPDTGPVPEDIRERALSISLPAPQLLLQQAVGLAMLFLLGCARRRKRRP